MNTPQTSHQDRLLQERQQLLQRIAAQRGGIKVQLALRIALHLHA